VIKNRENYEIINPEDVGADASTIILTARSGRAALAHRLEQLGFRLSKEDLDLTYQRFLEMADQRKQVEDADLLELMKDTAPVK
jgi:2-isopropylmalate synthase